MQIFLNKLGNYSVYRVQHYHDVGYFNLQIILNVFLGGPVYLLAEHRFKLLHKFFLINLIINRKVFMEFWALFIFHDGVLVQWNFYHWIVEWGKMSRSLILKGCAQIVCLLLLEYCRLKGFGGCWRAQRGKGILWNKLHSPLSSEFPY